MSWDPDVFRRSPLADEFDRMVVTCRVSDWKSHAEKLGTAILRRRWKDFRIPYRPLLMGPNQQCRTFEDGKTGLKGMVCSWGLDGAEKRLVIVVEGR